VVLEKDGEVSWSDRVKNEEVEERSRKELPVSNKKKEDELDCLLKHLIAGKIGGKRRRRRRKQLLDDLKGKRMYWNMKGEVLDRIVRVTRFGKGCGSVARETKQRMTDLINSSYK